MYERDKARYDKEMKQYTKDKPREKLLKTKKVKHSRKVCSKTTENQKTQAISIQPVNLPIDEPATSQVSGLGDIMLDSDILEHEGETLDDYGYNEI